MCTKSQQVMNRHISGRTLLVAAVTALCLFILLQFETGDPNNQDHGYLMTLEYAGQLMASLQALQSQLCWVSSFQLPLVVVEPYLENSTLRNSYRLWNQYLENSASIVHFHDVLNIKSFNEYSQMAGRPVLKSWKHFYNSAPRKVIVVTIDNVHYFQCLQFRDEKCSWDIEEGNFFAPCSIPDETQQTLISLQRHDFVIVRNVCLNCLEEFSKVTPSRITERIFGPYDPQDVTVIINKWRFSFEVMKDCTACVREPGNYVDSERVMRDANWYLAMYVPSQTYISVMIRMEWYFITYKKDKGKEGFATNCLAEVMEAVTQFQSKLAGSKEVHPYVTMDIGAYGSASFEGTLRHTNTSAAIYTSVVDHAKEFVKELYRGKWTYNEWKESFQTIPGIIRDKGYIATVQRSIASKGNCLILMGGGHFQHTALKGYLKLHPNPKDQCIKFVCVAPTFQRMFSSVLT